MSIEIPWDTWRSSQNLIFFFFNPGKKRVWVPDEQDAYVEAEVKTEATGGRVTVETKDQKVELSPSLRLTPLTLGASPGQLDPQRE